MNKSSKQYVRFKYPCIIADLLRLFFITYSFSIVYFYLVPNSSDRNDNLQSSRINKVQETNMKRVKIFCYNAFVGKTLSVTTKIITNVLDAFIMVLWYHFTTKCVQAAHIVSNKGIKKETKYYINREL